MATCNYLFGILLLSFIGVYIGFRSNIIKNQEPRAKNQDMRPVVGTVIHSTTVSLRFNTAKPQTSDFRPPTSVMILRNRVKTIYDSQIGVRETGSNRGPEVEKYLGYVGLSKGNPWCAAFVCWVLGEAGVSNPRSGWSPDLFGEGRIVWERGEPRTKSQESRHRADNPHRFSSNAINGITPVGRCAYPPGAASEWLQPGGGAGAGFCSPNLLTPTTGDVFGLFFQEKKRIAHVGFIDQWDGTWMISVEGNTNESSSREGDGVYRKRRLVRTVYKVARFIGN